MGSMVEKINMSPIFPNFITLFCACIYITTVLFHREVYHVIKFLYTSFAR